jgi:hypothetical protein
MPKINVREYRRGNQKLATSRRKTKKKHNTICVGHHYTQTNTNNVNKICTLLQTTITIALPFSCGTGGSSLLTTRDVVISSSISVIVYSGVINNNKDMIKDTHTYLFI